MSPEHGPLIYPGLAPILTLGMVPVSVGLLQKLPSPVHKERREGAREKRQIPP